MLSVRRPEHPAWLWPRAVRLPALALALLALSLVVAILPERVPVLFRDVSADPWTVLCTMPAMALPYVLDGRHDDMVTSLPTRIETLRAASLVLCVVLITTTVLALALLDQHDLAVGLRNAFVAIALCLLLQQLLPGEIVGLLLFVGASTTWIFGRSSVTGQVESWAVLLQPAHWSEAALGVALCAGAALLWVCRGSAAPTRRTVLVAAACLFGVAAVCVAVVLRPVDDKPQRITHEEGEGPLAMYVDEGGKAINAPGRAEWWATSGWAHPCVEGVSSATITSIRHQASPKPLQIETLFTFTPPIAERSPGWASQFGDAFGRFPDFDGRSGDPTNGGHASRRLPLTVDVPCSAHPAPDQGWVEMLTEIKVGRSGTHLEVTHVDYEAGGKQYTLEYRWQTVLCGDSPAVRDTGLCREEE